MRNRPTSTSTVTNNYLNGDQQLPERLPTTSSTAVPTTSSTVTHRSGDGAVCLSLCLDSRREICTSSISQRAASGGVPPRLESVGFDEVKEVETLNSGGLRP
jgi:hypothetical protein